MDIEYKYRKEKLNDFGKSLYKAPLTHYEAYVAYQSRYQSIASYPFPVTTFSTKQLETMQKQCMRLMLPKLGLNRNTPRAIIFGPKKYGGLQLMNLVLEQPIKQINATIGHVRRKDRVGSALISTMRDLQIEVGTTVPFYKLDIETYDYTTKDTWWVYWWKVTKDFQLRPVIHNFWVPTSKYTNDRNIMEAAVRDKHFQGEKKYKLVSINRCRLYMQAFFISDLLDKDKITVNPRYLNGEKTNKNEAIFFPDMIKPTEVEWSEWKSFIFRNFLRGKYQVNPELQYEGTKKKFCSDDNEITQLQKMNIGENLRQTIDNLPKELTQILGYITLPSDDGKHIGEEMKKGTLVGASDGSLETSNTGWAKGGHSYSIQAYERDDKRVIGYGSTPRSTDTSSQTTEIYGLLAVVVCIYIVIKQQKLEDHQNLGVTIYADNKEALEKGKKRDEPMNISETLTPDYDLGELLRAVIKIIPAKINFQWIKGHQDELSNGENFIDPHI